MAASPADLQRHRCVNRAHAPPFRILRGVRAPSHASRLPSPRPPLSAAFPHPLQNIRNLKRLRAFCLPWWNPSPVAGFVCGLTPVPKMRPVTLWFCFVVCPPHGALRAQLLLCRVCNHSHILFEARMIWCAVCVICLCATVHAGETRGIVDSDRSCGGFLGAE